MLMTLKHLLVTIGLTGVGVGLSPLFMIAGLPECAAGLCVTAAGVLALFSLSWPLYRLMHLRPICLPVCPHCGKRHGNYHVPADAWPSGILVCVSCGMSTRYFMSRKKPVKIDPNIPGLYLYWPEFVGLWRRVSP